MENLQLLDPRWIEQTKRVVELIGDESELLERRIKPLLPRIGPRLGTRVPEVMAAARAGDFEIRPDGSVLVGEVALAPDEVEIQAAEYVLLRERDLHAVAASRVSGDGAAPGHGIAGMVSFSKCRSAAVTIKRVWLK